MNQRSTLEEKDHGQWATARSVKPDTVTDTFTDTVTDAPRAAHASAHSYAAHPKRWGSFSPNLVLWVWLQRNLFDRSLILTTKGIRVLRTLRKLDPPSETYATRRRRRPFEVTPAHLGNGTPASPPGRFGVRSGN